MHYGKEYFKNRNAVLQLRKMIKDNMISIKEAANYGISDSHIRKWEKEKKINAVNRPNNRTKLYNLKKLLKLMTNSKKLKVSVELSP